MDSDRVILSAKQKALRINLNQDLYGTFAEIGAGQEVVRHFFRAGGASGTIAKAMSAYDKDFSTPYTAKKNGRYVCESRVHKMLAHEYQRWRIASTAQNTLQAFLRLREYGRFQSITTRPTKATAGSALKFQTTDQEPNEVILHARLHESDALLQHQTVGLLGVNLVYGCLLTKSRMEFCNRCTITSTAIRWKST